MKYVWITFTLAMLGGIYFTEPPAPNETVLHYIMNDSGSTTSSMVCTIIAAMCSSILIMYYSMRETK